MGRLVVLSVADLSVGEVYPGTRTGTALDLDMDLFSFPASCDVPGFMIAYVLNLVIIIAIER